MTTRQQYVSVFFFFNDTATTEIYTLSLHDALPISAEAREPLARAERHREIRVVVVDDVLDRLPRPEVLLAEAREVAGERQDVADEHLRNARRGRGPVGERRDQENTPDRTRDDGQSSHLTLL